MTTTLTTTLPQLSRNKAIYSYWKAFKKHISQTEIGKLFPCPNGEPITRQRVSQIIQREQRIENGYIPKRGREAKPKQLTMGVHAHRRERRMVQTVIPYEPKAVIRMNKYLYEWCPWDLRANGGRMAQHTLVWEAVNQQQLPRGWIVHHLNGKGIDNTPSNLCAMSKREHSLIHYREAEQEKAAAGG